MNRTEQTHPKTSALIYVLGQMCIAAYLVGGLFILTAIAEATFCAPDCKHAGQLFAAGTYTLLAGVAFSLARFACHLYQTINNA